MLCKISIIARYHIDFRCIREEACGQRNMLLQSRDYLAADDMICDHIQTSNCYELLHVLDYLLYIPLQMQ
jgi:hypothetical protein